MSWGPKHKHILPRQRKSIVPEAQIQRCVKVKYSFKSSNNLKHTQNNKDVKEWFCVQMICWWEKNVTQRNKLQLMSMQTVVKHDHTSNQRHAGHVTVKRSGKIPWSFFIHHKPSWPDSRGSHQSSFVPTCVQSCFIMNAGMCSWFDWGQDSVDDSKRSEYLRLSKRRLKC